MRVIIEFQASFIIINYLNLFFRTQLKKASCVASELPFDIKKKITLFYRSKLHT